MINVLIADDEPLALLELRSLVPWEELGFIIKGEARNGKSALHFLEENREIDLTILDINMPIMTGLKVIEEWRKMDTDMEYLIISAYSDYPLVRKAFKLGIADYIIKEELESENLRPILGKIKNRIERKKVILHPSPTPEKLSEKNSIIEFFLSDSPSEKIPPSLRSEGFYRLEKIEILTCSTMESEMQKDPFIFLVEEHIRRYHPDGLCLAVENDFYLLLSTEKAEKDVKKWQELQKKVIHLIKQYFNKVILFSGTSGILSPELLPRAFRELQSLHLYRSRGIKQSMDYIQKNYRNPELSFDELCRETGISRSHLSSLFKQEAGIGYKDYLNEVRISHALNLLGETDLMVQDVSDAVGFSNVEHFSRTFKNRTGISPSAYSRMKN